MTNPFSKFLLSLLPANRQAQVDALIDCWDALESLVIRVYQQGYVAPADMEEYAELRSWLQAHYPVHEATLRRHWPATLEAGHPPASDPFVRLFTPTSAEAFVGNWPALQALPAAREALNRYLLELEDLFSDQRDCQALCP
jgi:hypothetical protein